MTDKSVALPHLAINQHLLNLARSGRLRLPRSTPGWVNKIVERFYPFLAIFITLAIPFLASIPSICLILTIAPFAGISLFAIAGISDSTNPIQLAIVLFASFAPIIPLTWLWVWISEGRSLNSLGLELDGARQKFLRGLLLGCVMLVLSGAASAILGYIQVENIPINVSIGSRAGSAFLLLVAWCVQGAAEEILTRGYLLPVVSIRYGILAGVLVSSAGFMTLHLLNPNLTWIGLLNLFLFGVFAAFYALAEGSVWGISGLHATWNWTQGSLLGFPVSGSPLSSGALLVLKENGPDWLTGGLFGPEGGLGVTLVLLIAIGYLLHRERNRNRVDPKIPASRA